MSLGMREGFFLDPCLDMLTGPQRAHNMARPQEVNDFITGKYPLAVCNKCIGEGLGWSNTSAHPAQITGALATTSDFTQEQAECSVCLNERQVIRANSGR